MKAALNLVLTINSGSSSIRFALYHIDTNLSRLITGKIDRIGLSGTQIVIDGKKIKRAASKTAVLTFSAATDFLLNWLEEQSFFSSIKVVGHRVVHGMKHSQPERITAKLLKELRRITPFDPDHLPSEIALIEAFRQRHPALSQVACFDTAFHRTMPMVAKRLALPRKYAAQGVERYGFHGLSYNYIIGELARIDPKLAKGRVIVAHLGNGASLAAIYQLKSIDTSMGFTPTAGLMMSTRSGDLDPGIVYYLAKTEGMTAPQFQKMVNHESGLLGVSGTSSDVRDLLARERRDHRAVEALELFCYQAKKWIGAFAAALGGLDALIFAGGVGENSPVIRARICEGLNFLGVVLDGKQNSQNAAVISRLNGRVKVRIIETDEELMLARSSATFVKSSSKGKT